MRILFNISKEEKKLCHSYISRYLSNHDIRASMNSLTIDQWQGLYLDFDCLISSNPETLTNFTGEKSLDKMAGSRIISDKHKPIIFLPPLMHTYTISYGDWQHKKILDKLNVLSIPDTTFNWFATDNPKVILDEFSNTEGAKYLTIDIETTKQNLISCIGHTLAFPNETQGWDYYSIVVHDFENPEIHKVLREIYHENKIPVITHNGCFDNFHLLRYRLPVKTWFCDTEYFWNAWQAELPKKLSFLSSVFLHDYFYWKDDARTKGKSLYEYCAKDCQNTARVWIEMTNQAPSWAFDQYQKKFERTIPAIYCHFEGFKVDKEKLSELKGNSSNEIIRLEEDLNSLAGKEINWKSPKQVKEILYNDLWAKPVGKKSKSTDETTLKKLAMQSSKLREIISLLLDYRKQSKALTTYYSAELWNDRLIYSLNVDGTETDRMSCSQSSLYGKSHKNLGAQLQNIPFYMKEALIADDGYVLMECDYGQADTRGVAYLSEDEKLITALERLHELKPDDYTPVGDEYKDFFCYVAYELFGLTIKKSKDENHPDYKIRFMSKKVSHGNSYGMRERTLIDSAIKEIGVKFIPECMKILNYRGTQFAFVNHAIEGFFLLFKRIKTWWKKTQYEIQKTGQIVTPDGWIRIFHGNPNDQNVLRSAIAHQPQHLTVVGINREFCNLYYGLMKNTDMVRLKGQIHDSILLQVKEDCVYAVAKKLKEQMMKPMLINDRELIYPVEIKVGKNWADMRELQL